MGRNVFHSNLIQPIAKRKPVKVNCTCPFCDKELTGTELERKVCLTCRRPFITNPHGEPVIIYINNKSIYT